MVAEKERRGKNSVLLLEHLYDMYLKGIEFLTEVIGVGYYWIGSNKH